MRALAAAWAAWVDSYGIPAWCVVGVGTFIVHEIVWLVFNLFYMKVEDWGWFEKYKINQFHLPAGQRWDAFWMLKKEHYTKLLAIQLVSSPLLVWVGFTTTAATIPSWTTFGVQFLVFNVVEDFGFYWVHRLMHKPYFYKRFHVRHHEFTQPFSLTGEIAHPVEFMFNFLVPLMAGPFVLAWTQGVHVVTFWIWLTWREMRSTDAHSGYHLPFHPLRLFYPVYGGALAHDFHHSLKGRNQNFGSFAIWDWLCGTDRKYRRYLRERSTVAAAAAGPDGKQE